MPQKCSYLYEAIGGTKRKPFGHIGTYLTRDEAKAAAHKSGSPTGHVERYCGPPAIVKLMRAGLCSLKCAHK